MQRLQYCLALLVATTGLAGCQCCRLTDCYADAIDCIATHETALDRFYHPELDLNRIGRPDWCQCRVNRALCPCACERRKPLPHIVDTTAAAYIGASVPAPHPSEAGPQAPSTDEEEGGTPAERALDAYLPPEAPALQP